jgi:hypothetical protein
MKLNNDIDLYDINVWYSGDDTLSITAYELADDSEGTYRTNTTKYNTLSIPMDESHKEVIAYLLDNYDWEEMDWEVLEDYDKWDTTNWLLEEESPFMLKVWARSLPYYTPEKVGA